MFNHISKKRKVRGEILNLHLINSLSYNVIASEPFIFCLLICLGFVLLYVIRFVRFGEYSRFFSLTPQHHTSPKQSSPRLPLPHPTIIGTLHLFAQNQNKVVGILQNQFLVSVGTPQPN